MPGKRTVGLSAGEAVLGLVIERPDSAARLSRRLVERFRAAQFTRSTAHNALARLEQRGLVRAVAGDSRGAARREGGEGESGEEDSGEEGLHYEATPSGVEHFRAWLRATGALVPALREELQAKVEFCAPEDVPLLIEAIGAEERVCARMFAAAQGRLSEVELLGGRGSSAQARRWPELVRAAVLRDEAVMWGMRFKRLERLRGHLEELAAGGSGGD